MNHKVLLADDSLTIQKVIKITLANQPYDITDCVNEDDLFRDLATVRPKLVFLDFNLSEKFTGYELTSKIKSILPSAKVLLLLGTFDSVDDAAMEKCGASDKIVKPFDSNKFIAICKQMIDTFADVDEEITYPSATIESTPNNVNEDDQWTVSHSTSHQLKTEEKPLDNSFPNLNPLAKEMSDWGMSVPGVIDQEVNEIIDLPPVIGEVRSLDQHRAEKYETKFPESDDLDYPTVEDLTSKPQAIQIEKLSEKIIPLELEGAYVPDESNVSKIEAQIKDELADNLWHVDEFEDLKKEVSAKFDEAKNIYQPTRNDFDESLFKPLDDKETIEWEEPTFETSPETTTSFAAPSFDKDEMKKEMEAMVKKYVKEYMDQMFNKSAEKVAWEVIPDLAENLIRQELNKISSKIINE